MKTFENISNHQTITFGKAENSYFWRFQNTDYQYLHFCSFSSSFTGKEKDPETGYSYFGARYLDHELMSAWLSVDPMADKYPSISPYAYCAWNPVKMIDPEGNDWYQKTHENGKTTIEYCKDKASCPSDGKYLGLTYHDKKNSTYFSLYGGSISYDKSNPASIMDVNKIIMADNLIIKTVIGIKKAGDGSRSFWSKHNYMINTFSNVSSGAVSKLDGLKLLKRGLLGINVSSAIMAFMDYRNSFKNGPTSMSDHISFASSVVAFGSAYGAIASLYLDGINFAAKKGAVAESSLRNYFSPLSPSNFFKNCFGY